MGKFIYGIIAAIASFMLAESLTCNDCSLGAFGFCLSQSDVTCPTNTSVCFTAKFTAPAVTGFNGFNLQGCREPAGCNTTTNGTLLTVTTMTKIDCCSTNKCNPIQIISGSPSAKLSLTAVIGAAILASMWGSMLN